MSRIAWEITKSELRVIAADNQHLGVTVSGSVFWLELTDVQRVKSLWMQYKTVYTSDGALQQVMDDLSQQAIKVCVGDKPFSEWVVGSVRDALRSWIAGELVKLTELFRLSVATLVVPNVRLLAEVQAKLDTITQSQLDTEKAAGIDHAGGVRLGDNFHGKLTHKRFWPVEGTKIAAGCENLRNLAL